jgi:predicted alpha/beta hydrolase
MKQSFKKEAFSTNCPDGVTLKGLLLIPENPKGLVQFNAGTAAKKEFYLAFVEFICENGYICCLWDYRGSGESGLPSLKGCDYQFQDYGIKDIPTIKTYLSQRFPRYPLFIVGHSAGGQQLGFTDDLSGIRGLLCFAVSTGYLMYMPWRYRLVSAYFFLIFTPLSILFTGYVAAKRFKIMEDLPKQVVQEWRKWCLKPNYFFNEKFYGKTVPIGQFQNYTFPVHVYWTSDDPISNKQSIPAFWNNVKSTRPIDIQQITPEQYGVKTIGHFGFFKKNLKESLWQEALDKLNSFQ